MLDRFFSALGFLGVALTSMTMLWCCGGEQVPKKLRNVAPYSGPPDYRFDEQFPDIMEFEQGVRSSYDLLGASHVPSPGKPEMTIENLPENAVFDGKVLAWQPPCTLDQGFFLRSYGVHYILVTLKNTVRPEDFLKRRAALLVHEFREFSGRDCGVEES
jgi:hypothetical protein